jgi:hypothetical protein
LTADASLRSVAGGVSHPVQRLHRDQLCLREYISCFFFVSPVSRFRHAALFGSLRRMLYYHMPVAAALSSGRFCPHQRPSVRERLLSLFGGRGSHACEQRAVPVGSCVALWQCARCGGALRGKRYDNRVVAVRGDAVRLRAVPVHLPRGHGAHCLRQLAGVQSDDNGKLFWEVRLAWFLQPAESAAEMRRMLNVNKHVLYGFSRGCTFCDSSYMAFSSKNGRALARTCACSSTEAGRSV